MRVKPSFTHSVMPWASVMMTALSVRAATRASFFICSCWACRACSVWWRCSSSAPCVEQGAARGEHRLQELDEVLGEAAAPVGDAQHAHHLGGALEGQPEEGADGGQVQRQAHGRQVRGDRVGQHGLAGGEHGADERLEIPQLQGLGSAEGVVCLQLARGGDAEDGLDAQEERALGGLGHLANEAVLAVRQLEHQRQQLLEERAGITPVHQLAVHPGERVQHSAAGLQLLQQNEPLGVHLGGRVSLLLSGRRSMGGHGASFQAR